MIHAIGNAMEDKNIIDACTINLIIGRRYIILDEGPNDGRIGTLEYFVGAERRGFLQIGDELIEVNTLKIKLLPEEV